MNQTFNYMQDLQMFIAILHDSYTDLQEVKDTLGPNDLVKEYLDKAQINLLRSIAEFKVEVSKLKAQLEDDDDGWDTCHIPTKNIF